MSNTRPEFVRATLGLKSRVHQFVSSMLAGGQRMNSRCHIYQGVDESEHTPRDE